MAENETADAVAFLGEWLADDVQAPTREEIKLAHAIALVLSEVKRLATGPQLITTADQLRALPVGTVLLDSNSDAWQVSGDGGGRYAHHTSGGTFNLGSGWQVEAILTNAPSRVLHTPGGDRA